jgi:reticulon-4-interacting protein 1, mitochondrial
MSLPVLLVTRLVCIILIVHHWAYRSLFGQVFSFPLRCSVRRSKGTGELRHRQGEKHFQSLTSESPERISPMSRSSKGVYFGAFGRPVYEKTVVLTQQPRSHVLVKVDVIGLNPVDAKQVIRDKLPLSWRRGRRLLHNFLVKDTRVGFDFAGTVAQSHQLFEVGTRVFGTMPPLKGSCAEYISVPSHQLAEAPRCLSSEECAALPLVGLTAWQALSPYIVQGHSRVLILGGSGGTGHVALQIAKALGAAQVTGLCSTSNVDFVRECGASHVVDYTQSKNIMQELKQSGPFDVVLDCVTSADPNDLETNYPKLIRNSTGLLTPDAFYQRLGGEWPDWIRAAMARVNILPPSWIWPDPQERLFWIKFPYSQDALSELAKLVERGQLKPKIQKVYQGISATNVEDAFADILGRRVRGKIVIKIE